MSSPHAIRRSSAASIALHFSRANASSAAWIVSADFRMTPSAFYPSPETSCVIVETESAGTLLSGGSYQNRYVMLFKFSGDLITLWREYFNPNHVSALNIQIAQL